MSLQLTRIEY